MKRILLIISSMLFSHYCMAQASTIDSLLYLIEHSRDDTNKVLTMFKLSKQLEKTDLNKAILNSKKAKELSEKIGYLPGVASALKLIGVEHYFMGDYADALIQWQDAKSVYGKIKDTSGVANILSNMGAIYHDQSEYDEAIDLYLQALKLAEEVDDQKRIGTVLQNIGAVHINKDEDELAIEAFQKALPFFEAIDYEEGIGLTYLNIGEIHDRNRDFDQATTYFQKAINYLEPTPYFPDVLRTLGDIKLKTVGFKEGMKYLDSAYNVASRLDDYFAVTRALNSYAGAYESIGDLQRALRYFEKAKSLLVEANQTNRELRISTEGLVRIYSFTRDYKKAFENQELLQGVKDSIYNLETDQKIDRLLFNHEIDKKEGEIVLLVKDKEIQTMEVEKQKGIRNGFVIGFMMVLLFAGTVLIQRNQIKKGKKLSDELLLNILPEEVAEELKVKGSADAQLIESATVLFTDFKGFTAMAKQMSPSDLVNDLNECFSAFDRISEKYGIEKIKTIGDAYMVAGGLPVPTEDSVMNTVMAALEMQEFIFKRKTGKAANKESVFEMRVGIHTGPLVAGIVGVKKFQYDIWGDTVNTASRMESNGEVGKVNISQATYALLKDDPTLRFESRGKIETQGKGEMEMWFVKENTTQL